MLLFLLPVLPARATTASAVEYEFGTTTGALAAGTFSLAAPNVYDGSVGDTTTGYSHAASASVNVLYDMGSSVSLTGLRATFSGASSEAVYTSTDGSTWTTAATSLTSGTEITLTGTVRYVQCVVLGTSGSGASVTDVRLYNSSGAVVQGPGTGSPTLTGFTLSTNTVIGAQTNGTTSTGTVTLSVAAPAGGVVVSLASNNTSLTTLPSTVTVPAGNTSATFTVTSGNVTSTTNVQLSAIYGSTTLLQNLTVNPWLKTFTLASGSVVGGNSVTGTITLNAPAPSGGLPVTISSSDPSVTPPSGGTVTVPVGNSTATFTLTTSAVTAGKSVTVSVAYSSLTLTQNLTVQPLLASLSLSPSSVTGGTSVTGTVSLYGSAPSGGAVVALSSSNTSAATVPANVTVAAGSMTGTFTVTTLMVSSVTSPTITGTNAGASASQTLTVNPITLSLALNPTSVVGGTASTGTVTLNGNAPAGGLVVTLSSSNTSAATVPASVTVPAGQTSATFSVTTTSVTGNTGSYITAAYGGLNSQVYLPVQPLLQSVSVSPSTVIGGGTATGTVTLNGPAPAGGVSVTLSSSATAATVPASVSVAAGAKSATFTVTTTTVTSNVYAYLTAGYGGCSQQTYMYVEPLLASLSLNPYTVTGGGTSTGTITLNAGAPAGGAVINLTSSVTSVATVPSSVTVAANATSATFTVTSQTVTASSSSVISGTYAGVTVQQTLTVNPLLASVSVSPNPALAGSSPTGTVSLSASTPSAITVTLSSSNTSAATVPASVSVAANAASATFPVMAQSVTSGSTTTVSAVYGGVTRTTSLTVNPLLSSVSLNPIKVVGGDPSTGYASYSMQAPAGVSLSLTSSNTAVATVPATVSVTSGSYGTNFTVTTSAVSAETVVTITVSYGGVSKTATLTVEPMPTVKTVLLSPGEVTGGQNSTGTVTLTGIAPAAGSVVSLTSANTSIAAVPTGGTVTVASGQTQATFTITTVPVASTSTSLISASYRSTNASATLTVDRPVLTGFSFAQSPTVGGNTDIATLSLSGNAPTGGFTVQLSDTPTNSAAMSGAVLPQSVLVPAGSASTTAPVQMTTVNTPVTLTFTAQTVQSGTVTISGGESLTASVGLTLNTLHATDLLMPQAIQLQWGVSAVGNFLLFRGGAQIATIPNTATAYTDTFAWTSGQTYKYDIYDGNTSPATLLSSEQAVPYLAPAAQDQAVDSRLDPRYATNVYMDHAFGSTSYKGGLFAGFATDPSRVGRSFAQFNLNQMPTGGVYRVGRVNAYFVIGDTDAGPVSLTVGCQTIPNNTWSASTLTWDTAPTTAGFSPSAATQTAAIQYDPTVPGALSATGGSGQVSLTWIPPITPKTIASYTVWYGPYNGYYSSSITGITGTSTTVTGLTNGQTTYFAVEAVYTDGTNTNKSPSVGVVPPNGSATSTGPNTWYSWALSADILAALQGSSHLYSVAWAGTNETQSGWVYFAKTEYSAALGPNVTHLWSIPTLVRLDAPATISVSGSGTGLLTVNGIGLQGTATVALSSSNTAVATVQASLSVTGLTRTFIITPHAAGTTTITGTLGPVSKTQSITVTSP